MIVADAVKIEAEIDAKRDRKNSNWLGLGLFLATMLGVYLVVRANADTAIVERTKLADAVEGLQKIAIQQENHLGELDKARQAIESRLELITYILDPTGEKTQKWGRRENNAGRKD
jgi:hypothetical protein